MFLNFPQTYIFVAPYHLNCPLVLIYALHFFIQQDQKTSLQRAMLEHPSEETEEAYQRLVRLVEGMRYKKTFGFSDYVFLAKYYRSFQNEKTGKTVRFMSTQSSKKKDWF